MPKPHWVVTTTAQASLVLALSLPAFAGGYPRQAAGGWDWHVLVVSKFS
jgi:hypothetical protein